MHTKKQEEFSVEVKTALLTHPRLHTLTDVAQSLGYHRNTVSRAVNAGTMPRVRKAVAQALGIRLKCLK
jgi:DNA-binding phage protein